MILTSPLLHKLHFKIQLYLVKQIRENIDRVVSRWILTNVLLQNLEFKTELYLVKQIPENIDSVISRWILTSLLLQNLEFKIELVSCKTDTWIGTNPKLVSGVGHFLQIHSGLGRNKRTDLNT